MADAAAPEPPRTAAPGQDAAASTSGSASNAPKPVVILVIGACLVMMRQAERGAADGTARAC
jgi:hypothetical protein